mgnify:CR=1 FL=1
MYQIINSSTNPENNSHALLNDAHQDELNSSKSLKMMQAFRLTNFADPSGYFANVCTKNLDYYFYVNNKIESLNTSDLFESKHKEHHLTALAMSLYCDVSEREMLCDLKKKSNTKK